MNETEEIRLYCKSKPEVLLTIGVYEGDKEEIQCFPKSTESGCNALYEIGSITKVFTSSLFAKAVMDGKIALEDPIFENAAITYQQLSTHTSGLMQIPMSLFFKSIIDKSMLKDPYQSWTKAHMINYGKRHKRIVGKKFLYSNIGTALLAQLISEQYNTTYTNLLQEYIFNPLKMKDTYTEANKGIFDILIQGHDAKGKNQGPWTQNGFEGAGVIKSTVADLLKFLHAHMNNTLDFFEMTHSEKYHIGESEGIGLNWFISQKNNQQIIWHDGATGGYASFAGFNIEKQIAVVVLSNYINSVNSIGFGLLADRLQLK